MAVLAWAVAVGGADLDDAQSLYRKGQYAEALEAAQQTTSRRVRGEEWWILQARSLTALGRYPEAAQSLSNALSTGTMSLRLRIEAHDTFRQVGQVERAQELLAEINQIATTRSWALGEPKSQVALGRAAVLMGADAKMVLENFFNPAKTADPQFRETYLAIGQLALDKYDDDLAAKTFQKASELFPGDSDVLHGLARALASGDRTKMGQAADAALAANPRHVPTLLLQVDHLIDGEQYELADKSLTEIAGINPWHPEAWSYRAVLAHLRHQATEEAHARAQALRYWKTNPRVDHLIGLKLSQKYRFKEGSAYQRRALASDPNYLPAKLQLAQDLLRLGDEDDGWKLVENVHAQDAYDVTAYNLVTLQDHLAKFQWMTNEHFRVRMTAHEAGVYGERVLRLLNRARSTLLARYGFQLDRPTWVEMFNEQKDFAIRTFAMPGGDGYLAVCFGNVITANSPASQSANPSNWEAVLWHEFCHVVTLGMTKNKMPRWLSEGISVYEERLANPTWGQAMSPRFREMIVQGEMTPVSKLSAAFIMAKSSLHVQFAYFQSALVVEYLVGKYGFDALRKILLDLGEGQWINEAITRHTAPMDEVESGFVAFAKARAEKMGAELEWTRPQTTRGGGPAAGLQLHPNNFYRLTDEASKLLRDEKWDEAKKPASVLLRHYPEGIGPSCAYALMAAAHRGREEWEEERTMLFRWAAQDATALDAYTRLMEVELARKNWTNVLDQAQRFLAVNPLVPLPYTYLAQAAEALDQPVDSISAYRTLSRLDPADPANVYFQLARLLRQQGDPSAKRHLLQALEEAPRFREGLKLLVELNRSAAAPPPPLRPTNAAPANP